MGIENRYRELFEAGKYEQALKFIQERRDAFEPGIYHYNQGVNLAKLDRPALSRYQFEKALDQGYYSPALRQNLDAIKEATGVVSLEEKSDFSDYLYDWSLSSSIYTGINISLALLLILLLQSRKIPYLWLKAVLFFIALLPLAGQLYIQSEYSRFIAMERKEVLSGPSAIFEVTQEIVPAMKFIAKKTQNGWRYVVSPASHRGWVKSGGLKEL